MKLTTREVENKLNDIKNYNLNKPGRNKGDRGCLLEDILGIKSSSSLTDLIDGELKTFTLGETIAITSLKHCLPEIIEDTVSFKDSKLYEKIKQVIYVAFSRDNEFLKSKTINEENSQEIFLKIKEDFEYISHCIRKCYFNTITLSTITGPNRILQIRTKASKTRDGTYTPLIYNDVQLKNKYMAFYFLANFGKEIII